MKRILIIVLLLVSYSAIAAPRKKSSPNISELIAKVEKALDSYDIDLADETLDDLEAALRRAKRVDDPELSRLREHKQNIENMMQRVENVCLLSVRKVPADSLFLATDIAIPLSADAGSWHGARWFDEHKELVHDSLSIAHIPASGREIFWSAPSGDSRTIWQAGILLDGQLDNPHPVFNSEDFDGTIDLNSPYLAPDGITLYFSGEIPGSSIGSHDIFRAVRDGVGEDFSMPTNLGMPYASTMYDGFYAIDPLSGLGFFATDRTQEEDTMLVYTFIPNETRVNRPEDFDDPTINLTVADAIADFIPSTWPENIDAKALLAKIGKTESGSDASAPGEFSLYIPAKKHTYTRIDDFTVEGAREAMTLCLESTDELYALYARLEALRQRFASGDRSVSADILHFEKEASSLRRYIKNQRNNAIKLESGQL